VDGSVDGWLRQVPAAWRRFGLFGFVVAVVVALAVGAFLLWRVVWPFVDAAGVLAAKYGVNRWLARALALLFLGPLPLAMKLALGPAKEKDERKRLRYRIVAGIYGTAFLGLMWAFDRSAAFGHADGEVLKWWAMDATGKIALYDSAGFDVRSGAALEPVTPAVMLAYERQRLGVGPQAVSETIFLQRGAFDPNTGHPTIWFARDPVRGTRLFDSPGFDPELQSALLPMSPVEAESLRLEIAARETERATREREAEGARASAEASSRANEARRGRDSLRSKYLKATGRDRRSGADCVVAYFVGEEVPGVTAALLRASGPSAFDVFRPAFVRDGMAADAFAGDTSEFGALGLGEVCRHVVVGRVRVARSPQETQGLFVAEMAIDLRTIDASSGRLLDEVVVSGKGGGLSATTALEAAGESLGRALGSSNLATTGGR
jgi:hypothetical protein